ncbi:hydrogenase formation protein HypD [uncultured Dialister sp.]|uniref:hydrogenase formation protein HypD n=1 Tax=uncultured Dialister sp. TaxID=278064 RepID=UPI00262F38E9|nr:hydrogenase formation protein HypD [uncultured Dialister sp.]
MREKELAHYLSAYDGPPLRLMEVCGTHTSSLYRSGIRQILSPNITLLSGPGCPVCVTPTAYIDKLVSYAMKEGHKVLAFGDLLAVPGSRMSLSGARDRGGAVDFFYNPEDALAMAEKDRHTTFVLAAVGFETTAPVWADLIKRVHDENIPNIRFLTALKTMPEAMHILAGDLHIDGFLCPGHVAVITGTGDFRKLGEASGKPMVVGGFSPALLLRALTRLVLEASKKQGGFWNEYPSVVRDEGNPRALALMKDVFTPGDAVWRGLGNIKGSGLYISKTYESLDAGSRGLTEDVMPRGCCCASVLTGRMTPSMCPCFGRACTPDHPVGACMVSGEGACSITYRGG